MVPVPGYTGDALDRIPFRDVLRTCVLLTHYNVSAAAHAGGRLINKGHGSFQAGIIPDHNETDKDSNQQKSIRTGQ